jgi:hypothetical protein
LSSAILYVAIVVIWACVLIPRWLRRDSSAPHSASALAAETEDEAVADPAAEEQPAPASVPPPAPAPAPAPRRRREDAPVARERRTAPVPEQAPVDPVHRRVLSARRRLLLMLVVLGIASGGLAGARMAAWWVIVPPSVMLLGYLLLLRAAARADAERRETARYRKTHTARAPERRPVPVAPVAQAKVINIPAAPEPPEEEIYDQYADAKLRAVGD